MARMKMASIAVGSPTGTRVSPHACQGDIGEMRASPHACYGAAEAEGEGQG